MLSKSVSPIVVLCLVLSGFSIFAFATSQTIFPRSTGLSARTQTPVTGSPQVATLTAISSYTQSFAESGTIVTYQGTYYSAATNPACRNQPHPCEIPSVDVEYLVVATGAKYRLLLTSPPTVTNGAQVTVTGILVTPSSWNGDAWLPAYHFDGDIMVQSIEGT